MPLNISPGAPVLLECGNPTAEGILAQSITDTDREMQQQPEEKGGGFGQTPRDTYQYSRVTWGWLAGDALPPVACNTVSVL